MTMQTLTPDLGQGGSGLDGLLAIVREIRGLSFSVGAGAAASTKVAVAAIRPEDTILSVIRSVAGVLTDVTANYSIFNTFASATLTLVSVVNNNTCVVNGNTYTAKTTPTALNHFAVGVSDTATALNLKNAINAYESRYVDNKFLTPGVVATVLAGVVTVTSTVDGAGNGPIVTDTGTTITISSTAPAAVTATFVSAGNTDAVTVNGITFTIKTTPVDTYLDMGIKASDTLQAAELARAINAYENFYGTLHVVATSALGVVTIAPNSALTGNVIPLVGGTNITASAARLAGGTATGGVVSNADHSATSSIVVVWYNKQ